MDKSMPYSPPPPPPPGFMPGSGYGGPPLPPSPPGNHEGQPNVVIIGAPQFGPESQRLTCPHCQASISTHVEKESNTKTHLFALVLCIFGLWCCAPCPYCVDSCLVKKHYCPNCKAYLGQMDN
ncbi:PREDICTED: lipopolysaccharide-induced tumor necrosis factor-alpha factor homolog isoform X2 [Dufourea novaeangliae]|nr:PREDICTED: lipopolysaccharide-induced tumor necrosis factor-alpha factor homolog isoform X2 [Dufourea novaeangliae]XP_015437970.1 PREDICTED: lipopolysaccharide-induced tumor necrosis factor-alpha factor homolog isoform X2 [Dufourea novaeangliae]XP_015437979.1 PREDICTED: lipopolysaccharide-induced tumor necrosis factor-alpha factor homolog isoform X2 [Dufourea novaeangliae]XP_015437987.1 PREDICTED: lipopolysaccharide-induced tumor necrosis factor-alpha factor homolog isoform X2 [Dufourea novae